MAYRSRLFQFLCLRRFHVRKIALALCFLCFCCVFCSLFAVVCVVCTPLPAFGAVSRCVVPPPLLCVSHLHRACGSTWCFSSVIFAYLVVDGAYLLCFACVCVGFCAFSLSVASVVSGFLASGGVLFGVVWFRGLLGVSCCSCVVLCFFCLCWFWCVVSGPLFLVGVLLLVLFCFGWSAVLWSSWCCSCVVALLSGLLLLLFFWLVVVVVLLCPLFCSWWCCGCSAVLVAGVFLLCVAPSWCWFMRFLLVRWFLVVVGPPPLFLVRHDQARLCFSSWFNAECHPGWVAVWCFCSWLLWEFVSVCGHVVNVVLEFVYSVWCVSGSAFYSLESSVWSSFLSCCCFCSLLSSVSWAVLRFSLDSSGSCCFCLFVSSCCFCRCCCVSC